MNSTNGGVSTVKSLLVNVLYVLVALVGLLVGAYGLGLFFVTVIAGSRFDLEDFHISSLYAFGFMCGLPLILAGFALLAFAVSLLFSAKYKRIKYSPTVWVSVLMALAGVCLLGYAVFFSLQGL